MEFKTIIYIVLGILWFVFKNIQRKKKLKEQQQNQPPVEMEETGSSSRDFNKPVPEYQRKPKEEVEVEKPYEAPKSFEELLKEFTQESKPAPKEIIIDEHKDEEEDWRGKDWGKKKTEFIEGGIPVDKFKRFDVFDQEKDQEGVDPDYTALFKDADAARTAFVASEIFNRKY